jgi:hypothetical protein
MALTIDALCHFTISSALSFTIFDVFSEAHGSTAIKGIFYVATKNLQSIY